VHRLDAHTARGFTPFKEENISNFLQVNLAGDSFSIRAKMTKNTVALLYLFVLFALILIIIVLHETVMESCIVIYLIAVKLNIVPYYSSDLID
jgi:hypothetical protein